MVAGTLLSIPRRDVPVERFSGCGHDEVLVFSTVCVIEL